MYIANDFALNTFWLWFDGILAFIVMIAPFVASFFLKNLDSLKLKMTSHHCNKKKFFETMDHIFFERSKIERSPFVDMFILIQRW